MSYVLRYTIVPTCLLRWEKNLVEHQNDGKYHRFTHCAFVLSTLQSMYECHEKLFIPVEGDSIMYSLKELSEYLQFCIPIETLKRIMKELEYLGLIKVYENHILFRNVVYKELLKVQCDDGDFIKVWFVAMWYEYQNHVGIRVGYLLSQLMNNCFAEVMSGKYVHKMLKELYTYGQENKMLACLVNDGFLSQYNEITGELKTHRHFVDHIKETTEAVISEHYLACEPKQLVFNVPKNKPNYTNKKPSKSFDGVKSGKPDMDVVRSRWAELEAQGKRVEY